MAQAIGLLLYLFTILMGFAIVLGFPAAVVVAMWTAIRRRTAFPIFLCVLILAGLFAGGVFGWWLRPFEWNMPLLETFRAGADSETYGHEIESQAERVALYIMFTSELGLLAAAAVMLIWKKQRRSLTVNGT